MANPGFLNDLASSLNNLGIRYSEVGKQQEADRAWNATLDRFAEQLAGYAFLASYRALARPADELREACADLYRSLCLNDLPTSDAVEVRHACRELRQRNAPDFDAAWRSLTGELPAWLLIDPALYQDVIAWITTPSWQASCDYLHAHAETLLSDAIQPIFDELDLATPDEPTLQRHRALLSAAQQHGIDVAYRPLLVREVVNAWMNTDTWTASRAFLDAHHPDLASDEAMAILADLATDAQSDTLLHHAVLTLVRLDQAERAYDAIADPAQLQVELDAARGDVDVARLIAYAMIAIITASDDDEVTAQALFHLALGRALTDDQGADQDLLVRAKELAPGQVPVWLGHISALLGVRPDRDKVLIALSQALFTPPPVA